MKTPTNYIFKTFILAQQHSGSSGSNVPIGSGGVGHQASSLNPAGVSASHGIGGGGIGHLSAPGSNHSSSLLWAKTQQLPEELFRQVDYVIHKRIHCPLLTKPKIIKN